MRAPALRLLLGLIVGCALLGASAVNAEPSASQELAPGEKLMEAPDPTRLDVARLPPEAAVITRALYAHGWFLEAQIGALAPVGDAAKVSTAGPRLAVAGGYELLSWLSALIQLEGSIHRTDNRPPPAATTYELVGAALGVRLTAPLGPRAALWCGGLAGLSWSSADVLRAMGFRDAFKIGPNYGGELGFDWHVRARHHSLGVLAGARMFPTLARTEFTLGVYGSAYLRYVF